MLFQVLSTQILSGGPGYKIRCCFFSQWKKKKRKNSESFWIDILVNIDRSLLALNYLHLSLTHSPAKWVGRINRVRVQQHSHPSSTVCPNSLQQILTER